MSDVAVWLEYNLWDKPKPGTFRVGKPVLDKKHCRPTVVFRLFLLLRRLRAPSCPEFAMDRLASDRMFAAVVETGSFAGATATTRSPLA